MQATGHLLLRQAAMHTPVPSLALVCPELCQLRPYPRLQPLQVPILGHDLLICGGFWEACRAACESKVAQCLSLHHQCNVSRVNFWIACSQHEDGSVPVWRRVSDVGPGGSPAVQTRMWFSAAPELQACCHMRDPRAACTVTDVGQRKWCPSSSGKQYMPHMGSSEQPAAW